MNIIPNDLLNCNNIIYRGGNSCRWVVFLSCQYTDRVNIRQPKPDTNSKRVNIR